MFDENALIKIDQGNLEELIEAPGKWKEFGPYHLLFNRWNKLLRSRPLIVKGFGGWIKIKNLPLDYWCRATFEAIGVYFGRFENIAFETLNLLIVQKRKAKLRRICVASCLGLLRLKIQYVVISF